MKRKSKRTPDSDSDYAFDDEEIKLSKKKKVVEDSDDDPNDKF